MRSRQRRLFFAGVQPALADFQSELSLKEDSYSFWEADSVVTGREGSASVDVSDTGSELLESPSAASSAGINSSWKDSATSFSNSSMLGSSLTSFNPKRIRNSFVVL